ncbi:alpha/beta fold hydrolase [Haliangium ochraceum]|uniref:alpha/beta fold hydrolase n=1 Tax=Haliangium ochraceum TaxID=80816 RepID=UPI0002EE8725|nr:alpha/beta fold hydrolase [Haliangium ochraceum]
MSSADGTAITGNVFEPTEGAPDTLPAVVFVNSWALNEYEYLVPAAELASRGYVVMSYNTRGFGTSGGLINVAGPGDMEDLSAVLDWMDENTDADMDRVGIAGISYGAGISLLGLAQEGRIRTAVAMSGWGDLYDSLYKDDTPRLAWGLILIASGYFTGRMDPIIAQQFQRLLSHEDIDEVQSWAAVRSPASYVDALNASGKPVYISSNLSDTLFNPNQMLDFYERLTGPKRLDFNLGTHATAEAPGLFGLSNYVWNNAYDWLDYWLRDIDNGITARPPVTIEKKYSHERVELDDWPAQGIAATQMYLTPRLLSDGSLSSNPNGMSISNRIWSGVGTLASTGIPLLSDILDSHLDVPVTASLPLIDRLRGFTFWSGSFSGGLEIIGRPQVNLRLVSGADTAHVVVYLYDVDAFGTGTLITHGTASLHDIAAGQVQTLEVDLNAVAYDLPRYHRLGIVIDTVDPLYASRTPGGTATDLPFSVSGQMGLELPVR